MKHEWKKQEKELYGAGRNPQLIEVPQQIFITIKGEGNPNDKDFSDRVGVLYSLAYAIKMRYKKAKKIAEAVTDFTVYPLEGIWTQKGSGAFAKDRLAYTIMIRQPAFISTEMMQGALTDVKKKKPDALFEEIRFESMKDGTCLQILHIGSFDNEPESFTEMDRYAAENSLVRVGESHREIYLNNAGRTAKEKLHTILRYQIR